MENEALNIEQKKVEIINVLLERARARVVFHTRKYRIRSIL